MPINATRSNLPHRPRPVLPNIRDPNCATAPFAALASRRRYKPGPLKNRRNESPCAASKYLAIKAGGPRRLCASIFSPASSNFPAFASCFRHFVTRTLFTGPNCVNVLNAFARLAHFGRFTLDVSSKCPIAVYYEHPRWFEPLFAELDRRGVPYVRLDAARHHFDTS